MRTWKVWQPHKGERAVHAAEVEAFDADSAVEQVHESDFELADDEVFCVQPVLLNKRGAKVQVIPSTRGYVPSAATYAPLSVERLRARCSCGLRFFEHGDPGRDGLCRRCWVKAWDARVAANEDEPRPAAVGAITQELVEQARRTRTTRATCPGPAARERR